jgi:hypothetical protein
MTKYCYKCQKNKETSFFYKNSSKKDGLSTECKECRKQADKKYYKKNAEKINLRVKNYTKENPEKVKEAKKRCYLNNPQKVKIQSKNWAKLNLEKSNKSKKKYKQKNLPKFAAYTAKYRSSKFKATPPWFEKELVDVVYNKAKEWGFEVDHIVPLQGKTVCGLHCWANLQLLAKDINSSKRNHYWPDMP